jgi:hypothetical protein
MAGEREVPPQRRVVSRTSAEGPTEAFKEWQPYGQKGAAHNLHRRDGVRGSFDGGKKRVEYPNGIGEEA